MSKLNSDSIDGVCKQLIETLEPDAIWVSPLAVRAALGRAEIRRTLGLGSKAWPPRRVAFFPLHDANHWSLLVIFREQGLSRLYHYDSLPKMHEAHAKRVAAMLHAGGLLRGRSIRVVRVTSFPRQTSNWECGWMLIRAVQTILKEVRNSRPVKGGGPRLKQCPGDAPTIRCGSSAEPAGPAPS